MEMNYMGLGELGWRCTQTIDGLNGYYDWDKLSDTDKQMLDLRWEQLSKAEKKKFADAASAVSDACTRALLV